MRLNSNFCHDNLNKADNILNAKLIKNNKLTPKELLTFQHFMSIKKEQISNTRI